jgi:hypothetical protein
MCNLFGMVGIVADLLETASFDIHFIDGIIFCTTTGRQQWNDGRSI